MISGQSVILPQMDGHHHLIQRRAVRPSDLAAAISHYLLCPAGVSVPRLLLRIGLHILSVSIHHWGMGSMLPTTDDDFTWGRASNP